MARRRRKTALAGKQAVFAACFSLAGAGRIVSARAVREVLGGGSNTDLVRYINEWLRHRQEITARAPLVGHPRADLVSQDVQNGGILLLRCVIATISGPEAVLSATAREVDAAHVEVEIPATLVRVPMTRARFKNLRKVASYATIAE